ncbi:MAG: hypothetical protein COA84_01295 [Robiginitomaculum sp.]|nr:MAG: hypothetical protein COA84_01295 [Robiginitomaculum sp.]
MLAKIVTGLLIDVERLEGKTAACNAGPASAEVAAPITDREAALNSKTLREIIILSIYSRFGTKPFSALTSWWGNNLQSL